ncbi:hypothetical protein JTY60_01740 [symbiont of Argiope bruennichi]|uniref:hypothetical protein n=1 Tax=symbiont of Argiope bruennichi TaxID=2810479 RepID=UPI003DA5E67D
MKKFNLLGAIFVGSLFVCANIYHTVESSNKNQSDVYKISNNVVNGVNGRSDYLNKYLIFLKKIKNNTTYQNVLLFQSVDNENLLFKNVDNNYVNVFNESTKSSFSLYFINDNFSINQNIKNNYNYLISTLNNKLNLKDTKNYDEVVQDFDYQTNNYFDFDGSVTSKDKSSQRKFNGVLRDENFINFNVNSFDQNLSTGWGFWKIFQIVIAAIGAIIMIICGMYSLAGYLGAFSGGEALAGGASAAAGAEGAEAGSTGGIATGTGSGVNGAIQDANAVGETIRNAINTASGVGNIERFFRWFRCGRSNSNESSLQMDHIIEWDSVNSDNSENLLNELNDLTNNNVGSGMQDRIDGLEDNVSITSNVADNQSEESWYDIDLHSRDNDLHSDYEQIPENVGGNRGSSIFDSLKNWFHNSVGRVGGKFKRFFNFRGGKNNNNDIITELQARLDALRENADVSSGRNSTSLDDLLNTNHNLNEHMDLKASESSDGILYNFDNANNVINRPENPELNENFNSFNTNNFGSTNNEISNNSFDFGSQTDTNDIIDELQARIEAMKENISDYLNNLPNNNVESGIQDRIDGFGDNVSITSNKSEIDISGIYDDINLHSDYEQIPENVGGKNNNNDIITELQARLDALRENADVTSGRNSTSLDDLLNTNHTENNVGDPNDFNMQTDNEIYNDDFFDRLEARLDALRNNDTVPSGQNSNNLDDLLNTNHAENNVGETSDFNMQTDNVDTNDSIVQTNNNIIDTNDSVAQTNNNSIDTKDFVSQTDNVDTNDSIVQTNNNSIDTKDFVAQTENVDTKDFVSQTENVDTNDSIVQTNNNSIDTKDFVAQTENVDTKDFVSQTDNVDTKDFVSQTENVDTKDFVSQTK